MIKKSITYTDFNGNERTDDLFFNLSMDEIFKMGLSYDEGIDTYINKIVENENIKEIYEMFKNIVLTAYGEKSEDGLRFIKSDEISKSFEQTNAFSELLISFITNAGEAAKFINALVPTKKIELMTQNVNES